MPSEIFIAAGLKRNYMWYFFIKMAKKKPVALKSIRGYASVSEMNVFEGLLTDFVATY